MVGSLVRFHSKARSKVRTAFGGGGTQHPKRHEDKKRTDMCNVMMMLCVCRDARSACLEVGNLHALGGLCVFVLPCKTRPPPLASVVVTNNSLSPPCVNTGGWDDKWECDVVLAAARERTSSAPKYFTEAE